MNILEERNNLSKTIKKIDRIALMLEKETQAILNLLWDLKKDPDKNKQDIERMQAWVRDDVPFARLVHCLELPEDRTKYLIVKESRTIPLRCKYVDLYLDGSIRLIGRDGKYVCAKDLDEVIGFFYCL